MYCINCGVELADSETVCPLCGTRVFHPDMPRQQGEPPFPPDPMGHPEEVNRSGVLFILTMLAVLPIVICILCEAAGVEQAVCSCSEKCEVGAVNTECAVCSVNMGKCVGVAPEPAETEEPAEEPETGGSMGRLLLILAVAGIGGGAAFYFKVIRPKQQQAAEPEEDYGEEDYEDDGPPWDEDENSEEDEE